MMKTEAANTEAEPLKSEAPKGPTLKISLCTVTATRYATEHWHYSGTIPAGKAVNFGVWEDGKFIGCVIFSRGANKNIGRPYNMDTHEICELTRVALAKHHAPVTQIVARCIKILKEKNPNLKLIVSYADIDQNHKGGIYQAGNWIYTGIVQQGTCRAYIIHGKKVHSRTVWSRGWMASIKWLRQYVDPNAQEHRSKGKHKYLYPMNKRVRKQIEHLRVPYPKEA